MPGTKSIPNIEELQALIMNSGEDFLRQTLERMLNLIMELEIEAKTIEERIDYEMAKVIYNLLDPNTKAVGKCKLTIALELIPDDERKNIRISATVKSALMPTNPISTALYVTGDGNGELAVMEMNKNDGSVRFFNSILIFLVFIKHI